MLGSLWACGSADGSADSFSDRLPPLVVRASQQAMAQNLDLHFFNQAPQDIEFLHVSIFKRSDEGENELVWEEMGARLTDLLGSRILLPGVDQHISLVLDQTPGNAVLSILVNYRYDQQVIVSLGEIARME